MKYSRRLHNEECSSFDRQLEAGYFFQASDKAGYSFDKMPGITGDTLMLNVKCEWVAEIKPIIEAAQKECEDVKKEQAK